MPPIYCDLDSMALEVLDFAFVLDSGGAGIERAEVAPLAGLGILLF